MSIQKLALKIKASSKEIFDLSKAIIQVNCPSENEISILKENTILIGMQSLKK